MTFTMFFRLAIAIFCSGAFAGETKVAEVARKRVQPLDDCRNAMMYMSVEPSPACFGEVVRIGTLIETLAPPTDSILIMPGQSPSALLAYAQAKYENYAWTVPFTLGRFKHDKPPFTNEETKTLFALFKRHLPKLPGNVKRIGVVDYSSGGDSIVFFSHWARQFYQTEYNQRPEFFLIPLVQRDNVGLFHASNARDGFSAHPIAVDDYPTFWHHIQHENFDFNSPHGQFYPYAARDPHYHLVPYSAEYSPYYLALRQLMWEFLNKRK